MSENSRVVVVAFLVAVVQATLHFADWPTMIIVLCACLGIGTLACAVVPE